MNLHNIYCTFISNQVHLIELFCTRATKRNNGNFLCHSIAAQHNATSNHAETQNECTNVLQLHQKFVLEDPNTMPNTFFLQTENTVRYEW